MKSNGPTLKFDATAEADCDEHQHEVAFPTTTTTTTRDDNHDNNKIITPPRPSLQPRNSSFSKRHASFDTPREVPLPPGSEYPFPSTTTTNNESPPTLTPHHSNDSTSSLPLHYETRVKFLPKLTVQTDRGGEKVDSLPSPPLFFDSDIEDLDFTPATEYPPSLKSSSRMAAVYSDPSSSYIPPPPPSPPLPVCELSPMPRKMGSPNPTPTPSPGGPGKLVTSEVKHEKVSLQPAPKSILKTRSTNPLPLPQQQTIRPRISHPYPLGGTTTKRQHLPPIVPPLIPKYRTKAHPPPSPPIISSSKPEPPTPPPSPPTILDPVVAPPPPPAPLHRSSPSPPHETENEKNDGSDLRRSSSAHENFIPPPLIKDERGKVESGQFIAVETREEQYEIVCKLDGVGRAGITLNFQLLVGLQRKSTLNLPPNSN